MLKLNNGYTRRMCEVCSKLAIKTPERHYWDPSCVFMITLNDVVLVFPLLTLNRFHTLFFFPELLWTSKCRHDISWVKRSSWCKNQLYFVQNCLVFMAGGILKDFLQILLLIISGFERINQLSFPLKSSKSQMFLVNFRGNRS